MADERCHAALSTSLQSRLSWHPNLSLNAQFRDKPRQRPQGAILILEFFDRHGITVRRGDLRRTVPLKARSVRAATARLEQNESSRRARRVAAAPFSLVFRRFQSAQERRTGKCLIRPMALESSLAK